MSDAIDKILDAIIAREGGWVDHSLDRGGPTKYGITQRTLSEWRGAPATAEDVRSLEESEARQIYRSEYVEKPGFADLLHAGLQELLVDMAVNHGPDRAIKSLQKALGVAVDGVLGPVSKAAIAAYPVRVVYRGLLAERIRLYGRIISNDHTQAVFASGWLNRAAEFVLRAP